ncbi:MAG: hypothetical protein V1493_02470, partial [Candidatus Diapherotrites archaeon]
NFEIDVSGSDLFAKDYTVVVAETGNDKNMLAHKFADRSKEIIRSRHGQNLYRYPNSKKGTTDLKIRLYCVAIYFLFKELQKRFKFREATIDICRDFPGNEADIRQSLKHLLGAKLGLSVAMHFTKLPKESIADKYAFLIRHDSYNKLGKYCLEIKTEQFEEFLKPKKAR